jgi:hypothetical protein
MVFSPENEKGLAEAEPWNFDSEKANRMICRAETGH